FSLPGGNYCAPTPEPVRLAETAPGANGDAAIRSPGELSDGARPTRGARRSRPTARCVSAERTIRTRKKTVRYVRLGKTDLEVSAIAFGTWSFGGEWGPFDADEASKTVGRALDLGITFFDTAQAYGFGASERLLADALWERARRDEVILATKGGLRNGRPDAAQGTRAAAGYDRARSRASANLRTDYIDLYQV